MTKRELKTILKQETHCVLQHNGWPCGTCFGAYLDRIKVFEKRQIFWQSLLFYRGDYKLEMLDYNQETLTQGIKELKTAIEDSKCVTA